MTISVPSSLVVAFNLPSAATEAGPRLMEVWGIAGVAWLGVPCLAAADSVPGR